MLGRNGMSPREWLHGPITLVSGNQGASAVFGCRIPASEHALPALPTTADTSSGLLVTSSGLLVEERFSVHVGRSKIVSRRGCFVIKLLSLVIAWQIYLMFRSTFRGVFLVFGRGRRRGESGNVT